MSKKICVAQSPDELKFILSKVNVNLVCVPLSLHTQLYCIKNKIKFYNPINFINNDFYQNALTESENLIDNLNYGNLNYESHIKEYKIVIRDAFNSIIFVIELLEKIINSEKVEEIIISGWNNYISPYSIKNYFISSILTNSLFKTKITKLSKSDDKEIKKINELKYIIKNKNLKKNKKYILLNTFGYNFTRIILDLAKKNCNILIPSFSKHLGKNKIGFFKKIILRLLKVIIIEMDVVEKNNNEKLNIPDIKFSYKGKDLSKFLNLKKEQEKNTFLKIRGICNEIDNLFEKATIKLVLTNFTRGIDGYYLEQAKKKNIVSICIPHGTIPENFNKYDKIYKKFIAEHQLSEQSNFFAIQSKIAKDFIHSFKINHECIETGNLIFGDGKNKKKKKIIFAVTLKGLQNIQYLGVEMYYEFLDNLNLLNNLAKKHNLNICVKLHPYANPCFDDLAKTFKNLEFTKKKIDKLFKDAFLTISFSSTVIEDSLYSNVPVILLERWKRYKHCKAEEDFKKKNSAIYYVNDEETLVNCINTIKQSDNITFNDYVFKGNTKSNISNLINKMLNYAQ